MTKLDKAEEALKTAKRLGLWARIKTWFKRRRARRKGR